MYADGMLAIILPNKTRRAERKKLSNWDWELKGAMAKMAIMTEAFYDGPEKMQSRDWDIMDFGVQLATLVALTHPTVFREIYETEPETASEEYDEWKRRQETNE